MVKKDNTGVRMLFIGVAIFLLISFVWLIYGFSDNGRIIRDHGFYSSGISDELTKSIHCDQWAENNGYDNITDRVNIMWSNIGDKAIDVTKEIEK